MSYGKEFECNNDVYLLEIFDKHIYVAKKEVDEQYSLVYEGNYELLFWDQEIKELNKLEYEDSLYAIFLYCLEHKSVINRAALYQKYIHLMCEDYSKDEILASLSDEVLIYAGYYPLDAQRVNFESVTTSHILGFSHASN